ncbi:MAG: hypothetical protein L6406_05920 [Desulfobacterales bacterium]|nr:hypothetical protein [Desulfobacterales bacterium]
MYRKMIVPFIILLFLPTIFSPMILEAQDTIIVKSKGVGDIFAGREARARDVAIEDALRRAVEQAVGMFLNSETIVQNEDILNDSIYSHSKGYIRKYVILRELTDGKLYNVKIEAHVSTGKLQDELSAIGLLMTRKHKPRIMVIIPEYHINRRIPDPAGETEIIKRLLEKGFKVVEQYQVSKIRYNDQVRAAIKGNTSLATRIGLEYGAEVIIIGEAFSEYVGRIFGELESCRARLEARAIRIDTGEILVACGKEAAGLDITPALAGKKALQKAGNELGGYLIEQLLAKWSSDVTNVTSIGLVINGLNYKQFIEFKSMLLESIRGIKAIHQRSFTNNRAVVEIDIKGDAETLSEEIIRKDYKNFKVQITDFSANRLFII